MSLETMTPQELDSATPFMKNRIIGMAQAYQEMKNRDDAILNGMYKEGKGYTVVAVIGEYAIIEQYGKRDFEDAPYTASYRTPSGAWQSTSTYWQSIDDALLGVIGYRSLGSNSQFGSLCSAMLKGSQITK